MPAFVPRRAVRYALDPRDRIVAARAWWRSRRTIRFEEVPVPRVADVIPAGVLAEASDSCDHARSGNEIHLCEWIHWEPVDQVLRIWHFRRAWVFGGTVGERHQRSHRGGQGMLAAGGQVVPPSHLVMDGKPSLPVDLLESDGSDQWAIRWPTGFRRARRLRGDYFLIGNASGHFGHFMLEGLARLWALEHLPRDRAARLKFLVYEPELKPFARELFELAGVPADRIVHASSVDRVSRVVTADPAMSTHHWITEPMQRVWWRATAGLTAAPTRRIYLSRRGTRQRILVNEEQIEAVFADHGFEIVRPETLALADQIELAHSATHLAGAVGSQMYLAAFQQPGMSTLVLAPPNFYLKDDVLLAGVGRRRLEVTFGTQVNLSKPKQARGWAIDVERVREALRGFAPDPAAVKATG